MNVELPKASVFDFKFCSPLVVFALLLNPSAATCQNSAGSGSVSGTVLTIAGTPAAGIRVCLREIAHCSDTDATGSFRIESVPEGSYAVVFSATPSDGKQGLVKASSRVEARSGVDSHFDFILPKTDSLTESITVTAPILGAPEEIKSSNYQILPQEILKSAGSLQNVSQYLQSLPGVAKGQNDFSDQLQVRGGNSFENLFVIDNVEVPDVSHFSNFASGGGIFSVLDASLIGSVNFLTGGFPAPFGNATSSVIQIAEREGSREGVHGRASIGFFDGGFSLEGPLNRGDSGPAKGSWVVGFRRSFIDLLARSSDSGHQGGFPVVYTYNAKFAYDITPQDRLWFVNISDTDSVTSQPRVGQTSNQEYDNYVIGYDSYRVSNGLNWQHLFGTRGIGLLAATDTESKIKSTVGDIVFHGVPPATETIPEQVANATQTFYQDTHEGETNLKYDLTLDTGFLGKVRAGAATKLYHNRYDFEEKFGDQNPYSKIAYVNPLSSKAKIRDTQPSAYLQTTKSLGARVNFTLGGRYDDFRYIKQHRFSPRAGLKLSLTEKLSFHANYGKYYQTPPFQFLAVFSGRNGVIKPTEADHYIAGFSYQPSSTSRLTVEAYRKNYHAYPVSTQFPQLTVQNVGEFTSPNEVVFPIVSKGSGRSQGVEVFFEQKVGQHVFGQANFSAAETHSAGLDGVQRAGTFEYPYIANVLAGYNTGGKWQFSGRVTYLSGRPYSPFDPVLSAAQRRAAYDFSRINAKHLPSYYRIDLRIEHTSTLRGKPFSWYIGALNATDSKSTTGYEWNRRTNLLQTDRASGTFPEFGGEWRF